MAKKQPSEPIRKKAPGARAKKSAGRPSVLTEAVIDLYLEARRTGANDADCAAMAGISRHSVINWKHRVEMADPVYTPEGHLESYLDDGYEPPILDLFDFFDRIRKADAEAKIQRLEQIRRAANDPKQWTAAAWWLERRYPDEFGRRERRDIHLTVEEAEAIIDQEIEKLEAELARLEGGGD